MNVLRAAPACLLVAILACSDQTPTHPNNIALDDLGINPAVTFNERDLPFTFSTALCGETQLWQGTDHWVEQYTETPSGRILSAFRTNYKGTVVSSPSGKVYRLNGHFEVRETGDVDGFPHTITVVETDVLIGKGSMPNILWHYLMKVTINANGVVTADRVMNDITCQ